MRDVFLCLILTFWVTFFSLCNYKEYALEIRKAEHFFLESKYDDALVTYISVLEKYEYPYLKETLQATYVSTLTGNLSVFEDLITKCVDLGMTEEEYLKVESLWESRNPNQTFQFDYKQRRSNYIKGLNTEKIVAYIKLDKLRDYAIKKYPLKENNHKEYYQYMEMLRDRYVHLVKKYGYVNDKDSGRRFKVKVSSQPKTKNNQILSLNAMADSFKLEMYTSKYFVINYTSKHTIWASSDPGAWFLSHYFHVENATLNNSNNCYLDTNFLAFLELGVNQLSLPPYLLVNYLESTRCIANDFAFTYYSRVLLGLRMSYFGRYHLEEEKRKYINANREKYGFRSLEEEEKILKHLYFLKTGKKLPENYTNKDVNEVSFENRIFIQVMA